MASRNDITGALQKSKALSKEGIDNWDSIFGEKVLVPVKLSQVAVGSTFMYESTEHKKVGDRSYYTFSTGGLTTELETDISVEIYGEIQDGI